MSVTPRRSWPPSEGAPNQGPSDSQRTLPPVAGMPPQSQQQAPLSTQQQTFQGVRPMGNGLAHPSSVPAPVPATMDATKPPGSLKQPTMMTPQPQPQQQRSMPSTVQGVLPPASNSLFGPLSGPSMPQMPDLKQQQQPNLFMNGQADMNQPGSYPSNGPAQNLAMNTTVKAENLPASMYDFQPRMDGMSDFDQAKDIMQMSNESLFNSLTQSHTQPPQAQPVPQQGMGDVKPVSGTMSSPAMTMPVSGGKPKAQSAAMAQVRNASSWSSLAGAAQQSGQGSASKTSTIGDSFQMFRRQAKEKEARQKALIEQQELRRQQKEQAERERLRAEADRRREREEEEALEKARYVVFTRLSSQSTHLFCRSSRRAAIGLPDEARPSPPTKTGLSPLHVPPATLPPVNKAHASLVGGLHRTSPAPTPSSAPSPAAAVGGGVPLPSPSPKGTLSRVHCLRISPLTAITCQCRTIGSEPGLLCSSNGWRFHER